MLELPDEIHKDLKIKCASDGVSIKDRILDLINQYLEPLTLKEK